MRFIFDSWCISATKANTKKYGKAPPLSEYHNPNNFEIIFSSCFKWKDFHL